MDDASKAKAKAGEPDFNALRRLWRETTREWLAARNEVARLQDGPVVDLQQAMAAARRLEHAQRRREAVSRQLDALLGPASTGC